MENKRPYVMSLAGLDPSAGAGLLADIKTFEALATYGLGVCTALTVQTDTRFLSVEWQSTQQIIAQALPLLETFPVSYCKIGIVRDAGTLLDVIHALKAVQPDMRIVLDPVLKASAGYTFHDTTQLTLWKEVLEQVHLLTPNYNEALLLSGETEGHAAAKALSAYCAVLLKGGHRAERQGVDSLYMKAGYGLIEGLPDNETTGNSQASATLHKTDSILDIPAGHQQVFPKHGSGCVLSAAITAQLAAGSSLSIACITAKLYTEKFLASHSSLLGYHNI